MDPLDLSPAVLALVAAQTVSPADASATVITRYSLDRELDILKGTMLIPKTNLPAAWRDANPTKGYADWLAEQFADKTSWFELKQVQDDTVRRYRRVIQPGDPDQTQYPNYEDLMVAVNERATQGELTTRLAAYVKGSRLHDDLRRYNPMLQPRLDLTYPLTTGGPFPVADGDIPAWKTNTPTSGGRIDLYKTIPTIPYLNTHNTMLSIRGNTTASSANPGNIEQTRTDLQVGASYRFCVRAVWHDWTGHTHPYIRLQVRDTSNSTVVNEAMLTNLAAVAKNTANAPPLFGVSFIAPASGSVVLQIANMGPDTANGATGTATTGETYIFITHAYLVQSN